LKNYFNIFSKFLLVFKLIYRVHYRKFYGSNEFLSRWPKFPSYWFIKYFYSIISFITLKFTRKLQIHVLIIIIGEIIDALISKFHQHVKSKWITDYMNVQSRPSDKLDTAFVASNVIILNPSTAVEKGSAWLKTDEIKVDWIMRNFIPNTYDRISYCDKLGE
jgi:hypothetical protein